MINRKPNIGIVGGGIGGVAAAAALRQVGIDAVVYERSAQLGEVGLFEYNLRRVYSYET